MVSVNHSFFFFLYIGVTWIVASMDFPGKHYVFFVYVLKTKLSENIQ